MNEILRRFTPQDDIGPESVLQIYANNLKDDSLEVSICRYEDQPHS